MSGKTKKIVNEVLTLAPSERIRIVDSILLSLDQPDPKMDLEWKREAESRLKGYKSGKIKSVPLSQALAKYRKAKAA